MGLSYMDLEMPVKKDATQQFMQQLSTLKKQQLDFWQRFIHISFKIDCQTYGC